MHFFGKLIKTLLRTVFSIILFLLFVGLAKMKRDINAYIVFLNNKDRSVFQRSQPATWADPFRPTSSQGTGDIADELSDELDMETSGLNVYDPEFEQELNEFTVGSLSGDKEDFGFTTDVQDTHDVASSDSKSELLDLIEKHELQK